MIIFKNEKVAFALPCRTGSTSAKHFLSKSPNAVRLAWRHEPPYELLKRFPALSTYKIYCFLRNPLDNFISKILYLKQSEGFASLFEKLNPGKSVETLTYDEFVDLYTKNSNDKMLFPEVLFYPQSDYFKDVTVEALDFDNYEAELRRATQGLGLDDVPINQLNASTEFGTSEVTQKVIDFVKTQFADDCALWKERFGREIA